MTTIPILNKEAIGLRIKQLIIEKLGISETDMPDNIRFKEDLGIDSLDLYEIFMEMEKEFNVVITDEDAESLQSIGSVINYIKNKI